MALRTYSIVDCDVHQDGTPAATQRTFSVQGREFELDLCDGDAEQFDTDMDGWIEYARQTGGRKRPEKHYSGAAVAGDVEAATPTKRASRGTSAGPSEASLIREWAIGQKMAVSPTGKIANNIKEAYYAAQGKKA